MEFHMPLAFTQQAAAGATSEGDNRHYFTQADPFSKDTRHDTVVPSSSPPEGSRLFDISDEFHRFNQSPSPLSSTSEPDKYNDVEQLVLRIKSWKHSEDIFGDLLGDTNFPLVYEYAGVRVVTVHSMALH